LFYNETENTNLEKETQEINFGTNNDTSEFINVLALANSDVHIVKFHHREEMHMERKYYYNETVVSQLPPKPRWGDKAIMSRHVLHDVIVPSGRLMENYYNTLRILNIADGKYLAVHARLGGGPQVREEHVDRFTVILSDLNKTADCLARRTLQAARIMNTTSIFLATDTPRFKEMFASAIHKFAKNDTNITILVAPWNYYCLEIPSTFCI